MRRSSRGVGRRTATDRRPTDAGTIKSIERQRGTGSIGPDRDAQVHEDTGFTSATVTGDAFATLQVGDRVRFNATPAPDRPGYADATTVEVDSASPPRQEAGTAPAQQSDAARGRPPGASVSASNHAGEAQEALESGEEHHG